MSALVMYASLPLLLAALVVVNLQTNKGNDETAKSTSRRSSTRLGYHPTGHSTHNLSPRLVSPFDSHSNPGKLEQPCPQWPQQQVTTSSDKVYSRAKWSSVPAVGHLSDKVRADR